MPLLYKQIRYNIISGVVANYSALPNVVTSNGRYYNVLAPQGTKWLLTYKPKGIYYSDGATWDYRGEFPSNANQVTVDAGTNDEEFLTSLTFTNSAQLASKQDKFTDQYDVFVYAGVPFALTAVPTYIYSIRSQSMVFDEGNVDDVTIVGTVFTVTSPTISIGEKVYIKYKSI